MTTKRAACGRLLLVLGVGLALVGLMVATPVGAAAAGNPHLPRAVLISDRGRPLRASRPLRLSSRGKQLVVQAVGGSS